MKKYALQIRKNLFAVVAFVLATPVIASAQFTQPANNFGLADGNSRGILGVMEDVLNFFLSFVAILAVLMIVVSGIVYMTSAGNTERVETAKKWLSASIIGLVIVLIAYVIVFTLSLIHI